MSLIESIQQEVADQIAANGNLLNVPVLVESLGDLASQVERALGPLGGQGGKVGAIIVVNTPTADANWPEVGGPFFDSIPVEILVGVNPATNNDADIGTGLSALSICEEVCFALHQFFPVSSNGPLVADKPTLVRLPDAGKKEVIVQYLCRFKTLGGLSEALPQVANVTEFHSISGYNLACATGGAAIFYTLDGSNPSPRNGTLYTAPFAAVGGATLKARAWLAGYLASDLFTKTI